MKKYLLVGVSMLSVLFMSVDTMAQDAKTIQLEQTKGEFTLQGLTLEAGTYVFEISNNKVGHDVGFVIAPKGMTNEKHHIKEAYVKEMVKDGKSVMTNEVVLTPGEYVYFCPMNPTPQYTIIVK